jgi:hypothetical protein
MVSRLSIVVWILLFALATAIPASAHEAANFWRAEWRSQDRGTTKQYYEFTQQVPGDANGAFADRVAAGAVKWNDIAINGADMHFVRNGVVADYNPIPPCNQPNYKNGIHFRDTPDNTDGYTTICISNIPFGTDLINNFQVIFDPDNSWYTGVDYTGIGSAQQDVQGLSAHEFGHAVGGWTESTQEGHFDNVSNPGLCGSGVPDSDKHTMCAKSGLGLEASLKRSLEPHDVHTFQNAYA